MAKRKETDSQMPVVQSTIENLDVHVPMFVVVVVVVFFYLTPLVLSKSFNNSTDVPIDKIN